MGVAEEAVIRHMCELWRIADADAMTELFAEDGVYENVPTGHPFEGRAAIRAYLHKVCERLYLEAELLQVASCGDWVLSERLDTHVTNGHRYPLPVMNATRVVDGRIVHWKDYYDRQTVAELGLTE